MKALVCLLFFFLISEPTWSQLGNYDSLRQVALYSKNDTAKINAFYTLAESYGFFRPDSAIYFITHSIELAEKQNYLPGVFRGYARFAFILNTTSNYSKGLEMALKSLKIAEQLKDDRDLSMAKSYAYLALLNRRNGFDSNAYSLCHQSLYLYQKANASPAQMSFGVYLDLTLLCLRFNMTDSALYFAKKCYDLSRHQTGIDTTSISVSSSTLANVYEVTGDFVNAKKYYRLGLEAALHFNALLLRARFFNNYSRYFRRIGVMDSAIYYAGQSLELARNRNYGEHASDAAAMLEEIYEQGHNPDSAVKYMKVLLAVRDSLFSQAKLQQFQLLSFDENQRQKDILAAKERYRSQMRNYGMIAAAGIFILLSGIQYRNNRRKRLANKKLERQKMEIERQRSKAEDALVYLQGAQAQLVQSEKMASLGELTAEIAQEIQNPLNFVNNFSEVNSELIEEMKTELINDRTNEAIAIADNLKSNLEKIIHHGQRADEIVKGMLQHSRSGRD